MANTQETAISNVDRSNLNHTYSKVKELNESGNYTESIKVAEIGLLIALKKKNKIWVNKFDKIIAQMREISNKKKTAKNSASLEKFIYKSEHQNGSAEFSINLEEDLTKIKGLGTTAKSRLNNVGINSIKQLANLNPAELAKVKGFSQSLATNIISRAKSYLNNPESDEPRKNHTEKEAIYEKEVLKPPDKEIKEIEKPIIELNQKDENYMEILKSTTSIEKSKDKKNGANWILKDNANDRIEENIGESTELKDHGFNKNDIINDFLSDLNNDDIDFKIQKNSITDTINIEQNEFFNEWLHENDLKEMKTNIQHYLKLKNYQLIVRNSNSLFKILNNIDLLAFKILNVNNYTNLVLILPIKVLNSKGTLI
ncbi:MAG: helix-hairpin-helix domain-containing protein, partial [Candidatus Hermodarchaeota archaeon]